MTKNEILNHYLPVLEAYRTYLSRENEHDELYVAPPVDIIFQDNTELRLDNVTPVSYDSNTGLTLNLTDSLILPTSINERVHYDIQSSFNATNKTEEISYIFPNVTIRISQSYPIETMIDDLNRASYDDFITEASRFNVRDMSFTTFLDTIFAQNKQYHLFLLHDVTIQNYIRYQLEQNNENIVDVEFITKSY